VRSIDAILVRVYGVQTFADDPECILRITSHLQTLQRSVNLPDGTQLEAGTSVIEIHFWNEHLPVIEGAGADMLWGRQFGRRLSHSLVLLERYAAGHPALADFGAVHGRLGFIQESEVGFFKRLAARFGLLLELQSAAGLRFWKGAFWAGLYSWWLMWTFNPGTLQNKRFRDVALSDLWITRETMLGRYGPGDTADRRAPAPRPTPATTATGEHGGASAH
jgi:hypothetical protein